MGLIDIDPCLKPFKAAIQSRETYISRRTDLLIGGTPLRDFAQGYKYFGLHRQADEWVFHEWAPNATKIYLVGDFNDWQEVDEFALTKFNDGQWSGSFPLQSIKHGQRYKLRIYWPGGDGWRIPSYATRVVQDPNTHDFATEVWSPSKPYAWKNSTPKAPSVPLIYEAHVGMSSEKPEVSTFRDFTKNILPRIKKSGYNSLILKSLKTG